MTSINHDLNMIYIHIPKTAGLYIQHTLEKFYKFHMRLFKVLVGVKEMSLISLR